MKKLFAILVLGLFIASCNQGDYTYTHTTYDACRCRGGDEFSCSFHAIGAMMVNPMHAPGTRARHNCR